MPVGYDKPAHGELFDNGQIGFRASMSLHHHSTYESPQFWSTERCRLFTVSSDPGNLGK
jgi:hypothetical protein